MRGRPIELLIDWTAEDPSRSPASPWHHLIHGAWVKDSAEVSLGEARVAHGPSEIWQMQSTSGYKAWAKGMGQI